ncbi:hypothetical protein TNCV_4179001 [Trichonephila clavipes]|nr:hypothetical protein TNCV_4179001 [Trichonephila clavipes]
MKNRKYTKGRGQMWKKGQSSSFIPDFNKHRQAAKKRHMERGSTNPFLKSDNMPFHCKNTARVCVAGGNIDARNLELMRIYTKHSVVRFYPGIHSGGRTETIQYKQE